MYSSMMLLRTTICSLLATIHVAGGANILALLTTASHSHHFWNRVLMLGLAARGHHVTVLSPDPERKSVDNYTDLVLEDSYKIVDDHSDFESQSNDGPLKSILELFNWGTMLCEEEMSSHGVKSLMLLKNETFDLIIVESANSECYLGFVHYFNNPPVVAITAFGSPPWASTVVGNPDFPAYIPSLFVKFSQKMSFIERFINAFTYCFTTLYRNLYYLPKMNAIVKKQFGENIPSVSEIEKNISLVLVNTHFSMDYPKPLMPAMIQVGGLHIKPPKSLPQDIQKYMDEAQNGVIFFSLGTNIRSDKLGQEKIKSLLEAFKELPQRILWKFESDNTFPLPINVKLGKWLPQSDILNHSNLRLFITHGGLLSMQEAVYHGVPIVGMPFIIDQHTNVHKAVACGVGEIVDFNTLSKETMFQAVTKVLNNQSYYNNMKKLSAQFRDQPETPLERAVFWTEYVIRHRGAPHLRSAAIDLPWYQYLLLDVIAVVLLVTAVALAIAFWTIRKVLKVVSGCTKNKVKKQ